MILFWDVSGLDLLQISSLGSFVNALLSRAYICVSWTFLLILSRTCKQTEGLTDIRRIVMHLLQQCLAGFNDGRSVYQSTHHPYSSLSQRPPLSAAAAFPPTQLSWERRFYDRG